MWRKRGARTGKNSATLTQTSVAMSTRESPDRNSVMIASRSFCGMSPCMAETVKLACRILLVSQSTWEEGREGVSGQPRRAGVLIRTTITLEGVLLVSQSTYERGKGKGGVSCQTAGRAGRKRGGWGGGLVDVKGGRAKGRGRCLVGQPVHLGREGIGGERMAGLGG
jgi:hypothetical protein